MDHSEVSFLPLSKSLKIQLLCSSELTRVSSRVRWSRCLLGVASGLSPAPTPSRKHCYSLALSLACSWDFCCSAMFGIGSSACMSKHDLARASAQSPLGEAEHVEARVFGGHWVFITAISQAQSVVTLSWTAPEGITLSSLCSLGGSSAPRSRR